MKQCRPDSPTILLRSLFVPDPSPQPPPLLPPPAPLYILGSLPSSLFPLPALHNCSQKQHGPFPSLAITRSLQNLKKKNRNQVSNFSRYFNLHTAGPTVLFFLFCCCQNESQPQKYVLVLSKLCTFSLRGKTIFSAFLSIVVLYARSAAGGETFHSKL